MATNFSHKYANDIELEIDGQCGCPPADAIDVIQDIGAFRFVFQACDGDSFVPQAKSDPSIIKGKSCEKKCGYFSLSMFTDRSSALKTYKYFCTLPNFRARSGTFLAFGRISPGDGLVTPPDRRKHFELHENANTVPVIHSKFQVIEPL